MKLEPYDFNKLSEAIVDMLASTEAKFTPVNTIFKKLGFQNVGECVKHLEKFKEDDKDE